VAVTRTVGGVTCGYWAIGRRPAAMPPSRTMTIEMTHARTGRSMKKRANMTGLLSGFIELRGGTSGFQGLRRFGWAASGGRDRHVHELRLDGDARSDLLQTVHDHPLARPQAVFDRPQAVVQRPHADGTGGHLVLLVDDVEDLLALVGVDGALADQEGLVGLADGSPDAGEQPGGEDLVLVGEYAPQPHGAGPRVDLVVHEVDGPPVRVAVLVGQPQPHRDHAVAGRVGLALADELADA